MKLYISTLALITSVLFLSGCQFSRGLKSAIDSSDLRLSVRTPDINLSIEAPDEANATEENLPILEEDDENTFSYESTHAQNSSAEVKKPTVRRNKPETSTKVAPQPRDNVKTQGKSVGNAKHRSEVKRSSPPTKSVSGKGKPISTQRKAKPISTGNFLCHVKCPKKGFSCGQLQITISNGSYRKTIRVSNTGYVSLSNLPVGGYTVSISCVDSKKGDGICTPPYSQRSKNVTIQKGQESRVKFE